MSAPAFQYIDVGGVQLTRQLSIDTASDAATIDDNPGPGRIVDRALIWGGRRVERAVTWVLVRAGRGPTGPMKEIMRAIHLELRRRWSEPRRCESWSCLLDSSQDWTPDSAKLPAPPSTPTLPSVCEWLGCMMTAALSCPKCGREDITSTDNLLPPLAPSRKLVKLLASTNQSSRYISLHMITLLAIFFPSSGDIFAKLGVGDALRQLSMAMSHELDLDPLLAPCRRALVTVSDVEVLSLGKMLHGHDLEEIEHCNVVPQLIACVGDPTKMLLALTILYKDNWLFSLYSVHLVTSWDLEDMYVGMLERIRSADPVEFAVITNCFYQLRFHDGVRISSLLGLVPTIKTHPELMDHLPPRLRCFILDDVPEYFERQAIHNEHYYGRHVNSWRRTIWRHDPSDPEGEPDDDNHLYNQAARSDGSWGYVKIDAVWLEPPAWETCERRKHILEAALVRLARGEDDENGRGRCARRAQPRGGQERQAQSVPITVRQRHSLWYLFRPYLGEPEGVAQFCAEYP